MSNRQLFKTDAIVLLHALAEASGKRWNVSIDQILNENVRNEKTPNSKVRRGNRAKWGTLPCRHFGKTNKKIYSEDDLRDWFDSIVHLLPDATAKTFKILPILTSSTVH